MLPGTEDKNIYDIVKNAGDLLNFDLYLYPNSPFYATNDNFSSITFAVSRHQVEWDFPVGGFGNAWKSATIPGCSVSDSGGSANCEFLGGFSSATLLSISGNPQAKDVNGNPLFLKLANGLVVGGNAVKLGTILGVTPNPEFWPSDGAHDFRLTVNSFAPLLDTAKNPINQFQDVEVQTVPAPLPILGVAATLGSIRKLRKFSSQLKTFSLG